MHTQLIPFLNDIYPKLYADDEYYERIITKLENMDKTKWIDWAKTRPEQAFQYDEDGVRDYIREGFSDVVLSYNNIILSMEGKISMEEYGRQFRFFQLMITQVFKDYELAEAIKIYITG